jgi:hypothetical protein
VATPDSRNPEDVAKFKSASFTGCVSYQTAHVYEGARRSFGTSHYAAPRICCTLTQRFRLRWLAPWCAPALT